MKEWLFQLYHLESWDFRAGEISLDITESNPFIVWQKELNSLSKKSPIVPHS